MRKRKIKGKNLDRYISCSVTSNFMTPWTVACQAPLSMEFSKQEYWSGLPFPSPGDLPDLELNPELHIAGRFFTIYRRFKRKEKEGLFSCGQAGQNYSSLGFKMNFDINSVLIQNWSLITGLFLIWYCNKFFFICWVVQWLKKKKKFTY